MGEQPDHKIEDFVVSHLLCKWSGDQPFWCEYNYIGCSLPVPGDKTIQVLITGILIVPG